MAAQLHRLMVADSLKELKQDVDVIISVSEEAARSVIPGESAIAAAEAGLNFAQSPSKQAGLNFLVVLILGPGILKNKLDEFGEPGSGGKNFNAPNSADEFVDVLSARDKQHILYGDAPGSGGHLWPGAPGKTPFPQSWPADKVVHEVGDIVTSPNTKWYYQTGSGGKLTKAGDPAKWVAWETRDGTLIRVVYEPSTGRVVTAFPETNPIPPSILNQKVP